MAVCEVAPQLRGRGAISDTAARYFWHIMSGLPCVGSCSSWFLNCFGTHKLCHPLNLLQMQGNDTLSRAHNIIDYANYHNMKPIAATEGGPPTPTCSGTCRTAAQGN